VDKRFFVIVDEAVGEGAGEIDLNFQMAPGNAIFDEDSFYVRTDFSDGWNVLIRSVDQKGMRLEQEEGQVSFLYTKKEPRPAFRYRLCKQADEPGVRFVTLVAPYTGTVPEIGVAITGQPQIGAQRIELDIEIDGDAKRIGYDLSK
jgi:heparan-sulfate lyase